MNVYVPGACNIGPAERAARLRAAWTGTVFLAVLTGGLFWWKPEPLWALGLIPPAWGVGVSWMQVWRRFCVHFGLSGVFNFGAEVFKTQSVAEAEARRLDLKAAWTLIVQGGLLGAAYAAAAGLVLWALAARP